MTLSNQKPVMDNINHAAASSQKHLCPICGSDKSTYRFVFSNNTVWQCNNCSGQFLDPQPSDETLNDLYDADYFLGGNAPSAQSLRREMKRETAHFYLQQLESYRGSKRGKLLEIGCGQGELLIEAESLGYEVAGIDYSTAAAKIAQDNLQTGQVMVGEVEHLDIPSSSFDVVVNADVIEHTRQPQLFMETIHRILKPGGTLLLVTVSLDSWTARLLRNHWMEYKTEHISYFSQKALHVLANNTGFTDIKFAPCYKSLSPYYILEHFKRFRVPLLTPLLQMGYFVLPSPLRKRNLKLAGSGVVMIARST